MNQHTKNHWWAMFAEASRGDMNALAAFAAAMGLEPLPEVRQRLAMREARRWARLRRDAWLLPRIAVISNGRARRVAGSELAGCKPGAAAYIQGHGKIILAATRMERGLQGLMVDAVGGVR